MFGNILHTHIYGKVFNFTIVSLWSKLHTVFIILAYIGHGLRVRHMRHNEECNVTEELETLDENLQYDFNYQVQLEQ